MTLRAMTPIAVAGLVLAVFAGCGGKEGGSPSKGELAYSASEGQEMGPSGIFLVDREGKRRTRLTRPAVMPEAQSVSWAPTSDLLLFPSVSGEIWTIRSDGTELTKIADGDGASWSPNGKLIAVELGDAVEIVSPAGELQKRISLPDEPARSILSTPSWSPDGTKVAFAAGSIPDYKNTALFVAPVRSDGGPVPLVKPKVNEVFQYTPYWSPDGELLAFESDEFDVQSIWTSRPDGSQRKLVLGGGSLAGLASGGRAFFVRSINRGELGECPFDGGPCRPVSEQEVKRVSGSSSPDGRQVAQVAHGGAIVVSRADGSERTVLTDAGTYDSPQWSPDGERLVFVRGLPGADEYDVDSWVYVVGRDGKGARRLARGETAAWSPDGSELVVERPDHDELNKPGTGIFVVTLEGKARLLAKGSGVHFTKVPVVAPDTAMVAYLRTNRQGETLYIRATAGGRERKVRDFPPDFSAELGDLAWSSDGQALLVVSSNGSEPYDWRSATLYQVDLSGTSKIVATAVHLDAGIAVSNDGRVAFVGERGLEVLDLETRKRRTLVEGYPDTFVNPQWSGDSSAVAYLASDGVDQIAAALETVKADGSARTRVSAPGELVESFSW